MIDVDHIAKLARLGLDEKEKKKFAQELSSILNFVEKLNEVDTDQVEPMAHVTGLKNIKREDVEKEKDKEDTDRLVELAPEEEKRQVKVKAVL